MADYRVFVVPYDFSDHARAALDEAADLCRRLGGDLHLVHVVQSPLYMYSFAYAGEAAAVTPPIDMTEISEAALKSLREVIAELDVPGKVEPHVFEGASIAETLRESAVNLGADLIVMGTHGRTGLAHAFLGSVAERTLRSAPCPVLTVQSQPENPAT
jgi:nucleotide-binding universal stress UspA family protein